MLFSLRTALLAAALTIPVSAALAEPLTLDQAIARAVAATPLERAGDAAVDAARAARLQAGVRPNPSVTVEGENLVGSGRYNVLRQAEITATYSQPLEARAKREARVALADRDLGVIAASRRLTRLDLAATVQRAFLDVQIADATIAVAETRMGVEREMQREALRRVRGYKDPLFVETRALARVSKARIALDEARAKAAGARAGLASLVGIDPPQLTLTGELLGEPVTSARPAAETALAEAELARADAAVAVETTRRRQDWVVSGGARYLRGTDDVALVGGVTIPLGRFDRNQGNIARAQAERQRLAFTAEAQRLERLRRSAALGAEAAAVRQRAIAIVTEVYPQTTRTLQQVRAGYARGGFSFRDMQDAADAIIQAQAEWLDAVTRYRDLRTEYDRLTGRFDTDTGNRP